MALNGTLTVAAVNGVATFNDLSLTKTGTYTYSATDDDTGFTTAGTITVTAGAAAQLSFVPTAGLDSPARRSAGLAVEVEDQFGNPTTGSGLPVRIWMVGSPPRAKLGGISKSVIQNGSATFNDLMLNVAGNYQFTAAAAGLTPATSGTISVSGGVRAKLIASEQPKSISAGSAPATPLVVELLDRYKNIANSDTSSVTLSIATGPKDATIGGTDTVQVSDGEAIFSNVQLYKAGRYQLIASDSGLTVRLKPIVVTAGAAANIAFESQPITGTANHALSPAFKLEVTDAFGNPVPNGTTVNLSIDTGPDGATITGNTTALTHNGIASFLNLKLPVAGDYTFLATSGSAGTDSNDLTVAALKQFPSQPQSPSKTTISDPPAGRFFCSQILPFPLSYLPTLIRLRSPLILSLFGRRGPIFCTGAQVNGLLVASICGVCPQRDPSRKSESSSRRPYIRHGYRKSVLEITPSFEGREQFVCS